MKYYSQFGQDEYLDREVFKKKKGGFFIEIGAADGIANSNTLFFEKFRDWKGICIEPRAEAYKKLSQNRSVICENCCISDVSAIKSFLNISGSGEQLSGLLEKYDHRHFERINKLYRGQNMVKDTTSMQCTTLNDIAHKYNIDSVDYCSIDTEGGELDILKSIDFSKLHIDVISVENNFATREIDEFLRSYNYRFLTRLNIDDIFIYNSGFRSSCIYWMTRAKITWRKIIANIDVQIRKILSFFKHLIPTKIKLYIKSTIEPGPTNINDADYVKIKKLLSSISIDKPIVIDGEAHFGENIDKLKKYFPDSKIFAFESNPELSEKLRISEYIDVTTFNVALHEREDRIKSEEIYVNRISLDRLLMDKKISQPDLIKLNLQGSELPALQGSGNVLVNAKIVFVAVEFTSPHKEQSRFTNILSYLEKQDYRLFDLCNIKYNVSGQIAHADAIFINNIYYKFGNKM